MNNKLENDLKGIDCDLILGNIQKFACSNWRIPQVSVLSEPRPRFERDTSRIRVVSPLEPTDSNPPIHVRKKLISILKILQQHFYCILLNDAAHNLSNVASNGGITKDNELDVTWKKATLAEFAVMSTNLSVVSEQKLNSVTIGCLPAVNRTGHFRNKSWECNYLNRITRFLFYVFKDLNCFVSKVSKATKWTTVFLGV